MSQRYGLYTTSSSLNGNWQFSVRDAGFFGGNGTLYNWSISINYSIPATPQAVTWSPITDLYTDGGATTAYTAGLSLATVYAKPSTSGAKTYTATYTDGSGCSSSTNVTITATAAPTGTFTATENSGTAANDNTICAGGNVTFTAPPGYGAYTFYVDGIIVQGPSATLNTYSTTTLTDGQSVTVNVANSSNCATIFGPIVIAVKPLPVPTLSADKLTICAGEKVTFTAVGGTNYIFKLNNSSVQSGSENTYENSTLKAGDSVNVVVTDGNSCDSTSKAVYVTVNPLPTGTLTPLTSTICAGDPITFTALSKGPILHV